MAAMMKSSKVSAACPSSGRPVVVVAASPANWRTAEAKPAARPAAPAPRPVSPAPTSRPSSKSKPTFQRTSPEALAQFRREVGSLTGAPASAPAASYSAPKPAASASSWRTETPAPSRPASASWRTEAPAPSRPASSAERPSSRTVKPHPSTFQRTSPEALAKFRREVGSLTGNSSAPAESSYSSSKPASASSSSWRNEAPAPAKAASPSSWRSEAPAKAAAPAPSARPGSKAKVVIPRTSPEALAAFRREMGL